MTVFLNQLGLTCALGTGKDEVRTALFATKLPEATALRGEKPMGVATTDFYLRDAGIFARPLALGRVEAALPSLEHHPVQLRSRNNALLLLALAQIRPAVEAAISQYGPSRVGVILGTSTSGIGEGELAIDAFTTTGAAPNTYHYAQQELGAPAMFLARELKLTGPTTVISTACSSSAKAMASAARWLNAGLIDAAIVGGGDSLCRFTIAGFACLESVSVERCNPMSKNRKGINIGEAAALFLMTRENAAVRLAGWGETSDAHHMSAPEPSGRGAADAMSQAMKRAQLNASDVGYVNLHGTATPHNDAMESRAVDTVLGREVPVSSTKPLTGHTLGAAGALEAALSWLTLTDEFHRLPPHWFDGERDLELPLIPLVTAGQTSKVRAVVSNSFAFGGSNAALALVRE